MATTYQLGDVLLCHKHIGVAKFIGKLHDNDYLQLSSTSQTFIKPSDLWVGLQLAEQPDVHTSPAAGSSPSSSLSASSPVKAVSYHHHFRRLSFRDYFSAHYGLLIPHKCIHKKIKPYQILTKLTQVFHSLKHTRKQNAILKRRIEQLQTELARGVQTKKVQSTSQKSLESIIVDQNGNSYHHQTKITHTTTHSYHQAAHHQSPSFNKGNNDPKNHSNIRRAKAVAPPRHNNNNNHHKNNDHDNDSGRRSHMRVIVTTPADSTTVDAAMECGSTSLSEKATEGIKDNYSDRHVMSDDDEVDGDEEEEEEEEDEDKNEEEQEAKGEQKTSSPSRLYLASTDILSHHKFNSGSDVINEENEETYSVHSEPGAEIDTHLHVHADNLQPRPPPQARPPQTQQRPSSHVRRYSAPYKIQQTRQFGSAYEKTHDPYWKNSGSRSTQFEHNNDLQQQQQQSRLQTAEAGIETEHNDSVAVHDDDYESPSPLITRTSRAAVKHDAEDSAEWNMLPMIKQDPVANTIYRMSKINLRETHKRSASMSVVNVPRYFFERDNGEFPDLPDL